MRHGAVGAGGAPELAHPTDGLEDGLRLRLHGVGEGLVLERGDLGVWVVGAAVLALWADAVETDAIPAGFEHTRTTATFDNDSAPAGLLKAHRVADGVWGRLVVHTGEVVFVFEDAPAAPARAAGRWRPPCDRA